MDEKIVKDSQGLVKDLVNDCISRQAAIDVINESNSPIAEYLIGEIMALSSAQPEKRTETHACDCISRQAAIDALEKSKKIYFDRQVIIGAMKDIVINLPSVQPYTAEEIQKMQDIEQAQLDKAYEMGKADAMAEIIHCKDCIYRSGRYCHYRYTYGLFIAENHYCKFAERREVSE